MSSPVHIPAVQTSRLDHFLFCSEEIHLSEKHPYRSCNPLHLYTHLWRIQYRIKVCPAFSGMRKRPKRSITHTRVHSKRVCPHSRSSTGRENVCSFPFSGSRNCRHSPGQTSHFSLPVRSAPGPQPGAHLFEYMAAATGFSFSRRHLYALSVSPDQDSKHRDQQQ